MQELWHLGTIDSEKSKDKYGHKPIRFVVKGTSIAELATAEYVNVIEALSEAVRHATEKGYTVRQILHVPEVFSNPLGGRGAGTEFLLIDDPDPKLTESS